MPTSDTGIVFHKNGATLKRSLNQKKTVANQQIKDYDLHTIESCDPER